jgi:hypothetical protein
MSFISRNALSRTYLFRLALSKNSTFYQNEFDRIKTVSRCLNENNSWTYPVYYYNFPFHNFTTVFDHDFLTEIRFLCLFIKNFPIKTGLKIIGSIFLIFFKYKCALRPRTLFESNRFVKWNTQLWRVYNWRGSKRYA